MNHHDNHCYIFIEALTDSKMARCPLVGIAYRNNNTIVTLRGMPDWETCGKICNGMDECYFWTFYSSGPDHDGSCEFFEDEGEIDTYFEDPVSGHKDCPAGELND